MLRYAFGAAPNRETVSSGLRGRRTDVKKRILSIAMLAIFFGVAAVAIAGDEGKFEVKPAEFDPIHTHLVNAAWLTGIGCPTNAQLADANAQGQAVPGGT